MRKYVSIILAFGLIASLGIAAHAADVVITVTPSNPQDVVVATVTSAYAQFTPSPLGNSTGPGALWCYTGGDGSTSYERMPGQIWAGTESFAGTLLSNITELSYQYWNSNSGIAKTTGTWIKDRWSGPRQPIGLRMVIDPNDGVQPKKMFIYRPIRNSGAGATKYIGEGIAPYVDDPGRQNCWNTEDCLSGQNWFEIQWVDSTHYPPLWYGTWDDVKNRFPNGKVGTADLQPAGGEWPEANPPNTPNGCGLSLQWGAEMMGMGPDSLALGKPYPTYDDTVVPVRQGWRAWWRECYNGIAWVDNLRVGVVGQDTKVYDFEQDSIMADVTGSGTALQSIASYKACRLAPFVVFGKGKQIFGDGEFTLDDGSPTVNFYSTAAPPYAQLETWLRCHGVQTVNVDSDKWYRVRSFLVPGYSNRWNSSDKIVNRFHTTVYDIQEIEQ